eukprot:COSAG01_NODE_1887_length_8982_cov_15.771474_7_plen_129_part_00
MAARTPGSASTDGTMASSPSSPPSASVAELQHTLGRAPCSSLYHDLRFADSYSAEWGPLLPSLSNPLFRTFDVTGLRCPTRSKNKQEMLQMPEHSFGPALYPAFLEAQTCCANFMPPSLQTMPNAKQA